MEIGTAEGKRGPSPAERVASKAGGVQAGMLDQTFDPAHQGSMGEGHPRARAVGIAEQLRLQGAVAGGCHVKVEGGRGAQRIAWNGGERELQCAFTELNRFGVVQHQPGILSRAIITPADGNITTAEHPAGVFGRRVPSLRGGGGRRRNSSTRTGGGNVRAGCDVSLPEEGIKAAEERSPNTQLFWVGQEQVIAKLPQQGNRDGQFLVGARAVHQGLAHAAKGDMHRMAGFQGRERESPLLMVAAGTVGNVIVNRAGRFDGGLGLKPCDKARQVIIRNARRADDDGAFPEEAVESTTRRGEGSPGVTRVGNRCQVLDPEVNRRPGDGRRLLTRGGKEGGAPVRMASAHMIRMCTGMQGGVKASPLRAAARRRAMADGIVGKMAVIPIARLSKSQALPTTRLWGTVADAGIPGLSGRPERPGASGSRGGLRREAEVWRKAPVP